MNIQIFRVNKIQLQWSFVLEQLNQYFRFFIASVTAFFAETPISSPIFVCPPIICIDLGPFPEATIMLSVPVPVARF
jgi:hypothetical protein